MYGIIYTHTYIYIYIYNVSTCLPVKKYNIQVSHFDADTRELKRLDHNKYYA